MKTLRDNAFELAVFGWNYRTRYEKDIEKGKILDGKPSVQYQLYPPENWLIYLASLVLAGILGGLSYDAFKKIVSKMRGIFRSRFSREVPKEPELRKLYMYFTEYFLGMRDPKSPVFRAYSESLVQEATLSSTLETPSLKAISELMGDGAPTETITIPSEATPPSEDEVRAQLRRLVKERAKTELLVKRLQVYLQSLGSIKADE